MEFKITLLILAFICYTSAQTTQSSVGLKEELLKRADELQVRAKTEIVKLQAEKREHLATLLSEEAFKVLMVSNELRHSIPDPVRLTVLEGELIQLEYRVNKEISILQRETSTQEFLLINAQTLEKWVGEEMKKLETQNNEHAHQAHQALQRERTRLIQLVTELSKAQNQYTIERIEVELRTIEIRIFETLRHLGYIPNTSTPSHHQSTHSPTTAHGQNTTVYGRTVTTRANVRTTRAHVSTTPGPSELKAELVKKATELENYANSEIARLKKENKTSLAKGLQSLELEVKEVAAKLQTTTATTAKEILELIESELYWLERRLAIETEALVQQEKRIEKLLAIAVALKTRIDYSIKLLVNTPVGKALESESKSLEKLSNSLKNAKDDKTIINLEIELTSIEKRVNDELRPIGVPTTTKF